MSELFKNYINLKPENLFSPFLNILLINMSIEVVELGNKALVLVLFPKYLPQKPPVAISRESVSKDHRRQRSTNLKRATAPK